MCLLCVGEEFLVQWNLGLNFGEVCLRMLKTELGIHIIHLPIPSKCVTQCDPMWLMLWTSQENKRIFDNCASVNFRDLLHEDKAPCCNGLHGLVASCCNMLPWSKDQTWLSSTAEVLWASPVSRCEFCRCSGEENPTLWGEQDRAMDTARCAARRLRCACDGCGWFHLPSSGQESPSISSPLC